MSLSSPDCLRLHLGQQGWRMAGRDHALQDSWPTPDPASLQLPKGYRKLAVVLEHAFARCQLLQIPPGIRTRDERQAYTRTVFCDTQGIDPAAWQIISSTEPHGTACFVAAIETTTLTALQTLAGASQMKLVSAQPAFSACWNSLQNSADTADGALLRTADGRAMLGLWQDGSWLALRSQAVGRDDAEALSAMLPLLIAGSGFSATAGCLYLAGEAMRLKLALPAGWASKPAGDAT